MQRIREETQFGKMYLEEANALKHEQIALNAIEHIQSLEKTIANSYGSFSIQAELEKYSFNLNKETNVMNHVKQYDSAIAVRVEKIAKTYEPNLSIEHKRRLDHDIDF